MTMTALVDWISSQGERNKSGGLIVWNQCGGPGQLRTSGRKKKTSFLRLRNEQGDGECTRNLVAQKKGDANFEMEI